MSILRLSSMAIFGLAALLIVSCSKTPSDMVYVPEGVFIMGSAEEDTEGLGKEFGVRGGELYSNERPLRELQLKSFYIDRFEVSNKEYKKFVVNAPYRAPYRWRYSNYAGGTDDLPVVNVSWFDARNYCYWMGKRLPREAEWEKAARSTDGRVYPWGDLFDATMGNLNTGSLTRGGSFEGDKSPYGVYDMAGNVMEWVDDWYGPYPGSEAKSRDFNSKEKVLRGGLAGVVAGHYTMNAIYARTSTRMHIDPELFADDTGFRCAKDVEK